MILFEGTFTVTTTLTWITRYTFTLLDVTSLEIRVLICL
jgi:hypothetical protein